MALGKGTLLCADDRRYVLTVYVHRFTREHKPEWAKGLRKNGRPYPVQFADDQDWLEHTLFHVRKDGRLDKRYDCCESHSTWPDGK